MSRHDLVRWFAGLLMTVIGAVLWPFAMIGLLGIVSLLAGAITCGKATLSTPARPGPWWAVASRSILILVGLIGMLGVASATPVLFTRKDEFAFPDTAVLVQLLILWLAVPTAITAGVTWRKGLKTSEAMTIWMSMFASFPVIALLYANTHLPRSM